MPIPKPSPGGFFTDRSPIVPSKSDVNFKAALGRLPRGPETELAPREGHPLEQSVDWKDCQLAKAYPQWEMFLHELHQERKAGNRTMQQMRHGRKSAADLLGSAGLSAGQVNRQFGSCEKKCEEL